MYHINSVDKLYFGTNPNQHTKGVFFAVLHWRLHSWERYCVNVIAVFHQG